ncbi:hypothetical protein AAG570_005158 [Ranatra chinensis]|uniref:RBD domain-containing protein n=1 Tax=Ranatra chinensis TaxID=642074 RepID=A0ABD0XZP7_9HEMI
MMDLLVQVTTANKLSPAGHLLQPYGDGGQLPYKPSTPIGALDTWTVQVVPKLGSSQNSSSTKSGSRISAQPFEQTFRLQVHLPRNQLYVMRVSAKTVLGEILKQVCQEKCLDPNKYSLRHPRLTIADYRHNQICIVSNRSVPTTVSTDDILAMHHQYTSSIRSGGSSSRSLSPDSSISPQPACAPMRHNRKRRPAPKPPVPQQNIPQQQQNNKKVLFYRILFVNNLSTRIHDRGVAHDDGGRTVICHSRTSSDSSGYHEASVLSESPDSNNR